MNLSVIYIYIHNRILIVFSYLKHIVEAHKNHLSETVLLIEHTILFDRQTKIITSDNWAATCDFQQCGILTSVDSEEPLQPHFKLRNSK